MKRHKSGKTKKKNTTTGSYYLKFINMDMQKKDLSIKVEVDFSPSFTFYNHKN